MANGVDILVLDDPTIILEELSIDDYESATENQQSSVVNNSIRSKTTSLSPIIKIKDFILNASYIESFELDCSGFIPTCSVTFCDISEQFTEINYPGDGDLMKVYISTGGTENIWKPIRIDFQILSVDSYDQDGGKFFDITGEMDIPNFDLDVCEFYKEQSSFDACRDIAKKLQLGYSSNISSSDDVQTWLSLYGTRKSLLNKIVKHAYLDENSFITAFVDPYYYLNFVECNNIINDADNDDRTVEQLDKIKYISDCINADPDFQDEEENEAPDFITNSNAYLASNIGISYYGPVNNCGSTVQQHGKKIYTRYWDDNEEEYRVEFITPFISEGQNLKQIAYKEDDENSIKKNTKKLKMHPQTENMHKNYNYAEVCNKLNLAEIDKYGLTVTLTGFNPQITRFQKKYVAIYTKNPFVHANMLKRTNENNTQIVEEDTDVVLNKELSGFYTVTAISYFLHEGYLMTNLELRKRAIKINKN